MSHYIEKILYILNKFIEKKKMIFFMVFENY